MHWTDFEDAECECDHEHCSHDTLTGRSTCELCGATWYPSGDEVKTMRELEDIDLNKLPPNVIICKDDSDDDLPF